MERVRRCVMHGAEASNAGLSARRARFALEWETNICGCKVCHWLLEEELDRNSDVPPAWKGRFRELDLTQLQDQDQQEQEEHRHREPARHVSRSSLARGLEELLKTTSQSGIICRLYCGASSSLIAFAVQSMPHAFRTI